MNGNRRLAGSEAVEDYVRAIHRTARGPRQVASTTPVAAFLNVTPASVAVPGHQAGVARSDLAPSTAVSFEGVTR